ncbi:isocitrate lyase/PEP mutase family protein [Arthrobacter sp. USHLN218]|uniref:isocitrate lyase/PEP mutase family protein n=1 Tax=Arthrobacter sp. USHLN218 TaxID=3081232 RepID=UPI00301A5C32
MNSLKTMLRSGGPVVAPGVHDALGARLTESVGFTAVSISGFGVSASKLGSPDIGLLTLTEMVTAAKEIASCVDIPVMCDGDTGYGDATNVRRAVAEFEAAGVSSLMLEDQVAPKRCSLQSGVKVVPVDEYLPKLDAALSARGSEEFLIVARTDARAQHGLDEAITRGRVYAEMGADIVYVEGIRTRDEAARIRDGIKDVPLLYNVQEDSEYPYLLPPEAYRLGYQVVMYPIALTRLYTHVAERYLRTLLNGEDTNGFVEAMSTVEQLEGLVKLDAWRALEADSLSAAGRLLPSRP